MPYIWKTQLENHFASKITNIIAQSGGDINKAFCIKCDGRTYFFKYNDSPIAAALLKAELYGLNIIRKSTTLSILDNVVYIPLNKGAGLLMPYIPSGKKNNTFWQEFATILSQLHKASNHTFGLDKDNFIGTLIQTNTPREDWPTFYREQRIMPLIKQAFDDTLIAKKDIQSAEQLCRRIKNIYPAESPSLLHGDLWSGNFICDIDHHPILIDPATYFGHREMDIAMTQLFGGFSPLFYNYYQDHYKMTPGWEGRIKYGQLYYLLVHLILFGPSYRSQVVEILKPFR